MTPEVSYFFSCGDSFQPDLLNLHVGRQGCFLPLLKTASPANSSGKEIIASHTSSATGVQDMQDWAWLRVGGTGNPIPDPILALADHKQPKNSENMRIPSKEMLKMEIFGAAESLHCLAVRSPFNYRN